MCTRKSVVATLAFVWLALGYPHVDAEPRDPLDAAYRPHVELNGTLGVTPDPLIPTQDPYFREARNGFPVTIPPNKVQSAWIEVLVPKNARSGYYAATVTVYDGSSVLAEVPAVLKVWKFALPSTATLRTAFGMSWNGMCVQAYGSYYNCAQYPGSGGSNDRGVELTHISQATLPSTIG